MSDFSLEGFLHGGCGGKYRRVTETAAVTISGMRVSIEREVFRCSSCHDTRRTFDQLEAAERVARDQVRSTFALLPPTEITAVRVSLGLELKPFAALIPVTEGVVRGWEKGSYVQNQAADAVLRQLASDPVFATAAAARAGISLPVVVAGPRTAAGVLIIPAGSPVEPATPAVGTDASTTAGDGTAPSLVPLTVDRAARGGRGAVASRESDAGTTASTSGPAAPGE
jgi:DNA-binding transcriptional regulator YiaG